MVIASCVICVLYMVCLWYVARCLIVAVWLPRRLSLLFEICLLQVGCVCCLMFAVLCVLYIVLCFVFVARV